MDITETDTVLTLWTAALTRTVMDKRDGDWMALLVATADGQLKGEYRFRYHASPGFDVVDQINRYAMTTTDTPADRAKLHAAFRLLLATNSFYDVKETTINGPAKKLTEALLELPNWRTQLTRLDTKARSA